LQTRWPASVIARISPAMRRISEPDMPSDITDMRRASSVVLAVSSVPVADPGSNMAASVRERARWRSDIAMVGAGGLLETYRKKRAR
jgi:hypothetical protein